MAGGYKLFRKIHRQDVSINNLTGQVRELDERLSRYVEYWKYAKPAWNGKTNYLAIGNSLTIVGGKWNRGVCSTQPDNDYYGLVIASLDHSGFDRADRRAGNKDDSEDEKDDETSREVVAYRYNFNIWERSPIREKVLDLLNLYLSSSIDIITLQLGENVSLLADKDSDLYEADLERLVDYVKSSAPNALIILIDDFWNDKKSEIRRRVAEKMGCLFADLSPIRGKREYQSQEGTVCYMADGSIEHVSREAETHPGDEGMRFIAESVWEQLHTQVKNGKD